jgi:hypothetical protein
MGEMGIASDLPESGGVDDIDVAFYEFGKGFFRPGFGVLAKQFMVRFHIHFMAPATAENRTRKMFLTPGVNCANVSRNSLQDTPCRNENNRDLAASLPVGHSNLNYSKSCSSNPG